MKSLRAILPTLLPIVFAWSQKLEKSILQDGEALNETQLADARQAGVLHPEKIRLIQVDELPRPESEDFLFAAHQIGFYGARTNGLSAGYGMCIRKEYWQDPYTFVHEYVHIAQYERLGSQSAFLQEYFRQCIEPGYPFGQLEQEAVHTARNFSKKSGPLPSV